MLWSANIKLREITWLVAFPTLAKFFQYLVMLVFLLSKFKIYGNQQRYLKGFYENSKRWYVWSWTILLKKQKVTTSLRSGPFLKLWLTTTFYFTFSHYHFQQEVVLFGNLHHWQLFHSQQRPRLCSWSWTRHTRWSWCWRWCPWPPGCSPWSAATTCPGPVSAPPAPSQ